MKRRMSDRKYPYTSLMLIPTSQTIPFICRECELNQEATIYRDVREEAISIGRPNQAHGGIPAEQRYDFVFCMGCQVFYRKNDYLKIRNANIIDPTRLERLDPGFNQTTAFVASPEYNPANIATEDVRRRLQDDFNCFNDDFLPSGFKVCPL